MTTVDSGKNMSKRFFAFLALCLTLSFAFTTALRAATTTIDDEDSGWSTVGTWTEFTTGNGINSDMYYDETGTGTETATWNFGTLNGTYDVEVHYTTHSNRATNAPYTVKNHSAVVTLPTVTLPIASVSDNVDETGAADANATTIVVNQERDNTGNVGANDVNSGWVNIGRYTWNGSGNAIVILTDNANEFVIADAVRVTDVPPAISPSRAAVNGGTIILNGGNVIIR